MAWGCVTGERGLVPLNGEDAWTHPVVEPVDDGADRAISGLDNIAEFDHGALPFDGADVGVAEPVEILLRLDGGELAGGFTVCAVLQSDPGTTEPADMTGCAGWSTSYNHCVTQ